MSADDTARYMRDEAEVQATMEILQGGLDISVWTNRDLLHWLIDQGWLNLLSDFKDVNGEHLLQLREDVAIWLREGKKAGADNFPLHIAGNDAEKEAKLNSLRSLGYSLLRQSPERKSKPSKIEDGVVGATASSSQMVLNKWGRTVNVFQACHKHYSMWYGWWATIFTVFVVSLNAIIGGAIFSSISDSDDHSFESPIRMVAAALSIISGIAAAVRSALRLEAIAEQHAAAAKRFGKLYVRFNDMSQMMDIEYKRGGKKAAEWQDWFKDYMDVMEQAPMIQDTTYDMLRDKMYNWHEPVKPTCGKASSVAPAELV